jgi:hypothetical protein
VKRFAFSVWTAAALLVLAAPFAHAEGYAGFRAGGNLASFTGGDADDYPDSRTGFTGGVFLGFDSGQHLGFRTDLLYTQKGGASGESTIIKLDYIEMAPLLVGRFELSKGYGLRVYAGPVIGLWVNAEATFPYDDGQGNEGQADIDLGEIIEHWEFSGTIGAEFNAQLGPYIALIDARYTQGSRVFEDVGLIGEPIDINVSNSGIGIMAGLMVPF